MQVYQQALDQAVAHHRSGDLSKAEFLYNRVFNRDPMNAGLQMALANLYMQKEFNALAVCLLSNVVAADPKNAVALCDLGVALRKEGFTDHAKVVWNKALEIAGDTVEVCNNMAGLYADGGDPYEAIRWCDRASAACKESNADRYDALWNKSLALLSLQRWSEGWDLYELRQKKPKWDSRPHISAPLWDFKPVKHLYIHGEQGIGDEVMFLSVIPDVLALAQIITVEVNPKVYELVRQTWPELRVVTEETLGDYDAKIPLGSLACRFRRETQAFPGKPYVTPDPERVAFYRAELQKRGKGPYVALTWVGGNQATRILERSISIGLFKPIMDAYTCVSAQYGAEVNELIEHERRESGLPKIDDLSTGMDMAAQAALFKAVDAVVTVQQTAVHVAGSVGAKTFALISSHPHWRYGVTGENIPWYDSVTLLRNKDDWNAVIQDALHRLKGYFRCL
jgi:Tfp pilus assembly protein PilF